MASSKPSLTQLTLKNSFWLFAVNLINKLGSMIFTIILIRILLPADFGIYNLALSIALILITFADLGINITLVRYFAFSIGKGKNQEAAAYFRFLFKIKFVLTLILSAIILIISYPLSIHIFKKPELFYPLLISGFYVFVLSIEGFLSSYFYAIKKVNLISVREAIVQILKISLLILIFFLIPSKHYLSSIILAITFTYLCLIFFNLYYISKFSPFLFKKSQSLINKKEVIRYLIFTTIAAISTIFYGYIDTIMLGLFLPDASYIGFYRAAFALVFGIAVILSFGNILLPIFSQLNNRMTKIAFAKTTRYLFMISIPAAFGLMSLGNYFIRAIFGYEYLSASILLAILSFLIIETALNSLFVSTFQAKGVPERITIPLIVSAVLNILLNIILIKALMPYSLLMATAGAAIATIISRYFYLFILAFYLKKDFNLDLNFKSSIKPIISSIVMILFLIILKNIFTDINLYNGLFLVLTGAIVYLVMMIILKGITKEDFTIAKTFIRNLFSRR